MQWASWSSHLLLAASGLVALVTFVPAQTTSPNFRAVYSKRKRNRRQILLAEWRQTRGWRPRIRADAEGWLDTVVSRQPVLRHGRRYRRVPEAASRHWCRSDHAATRPASAGNQGRWLDLCR